MGGNAEITLNLTNLGSELAETVDSITEAFKHQFKVIPDRIKSDGRTIKEEIKKFYDGFTEAIQEGDRKEVFGVLATGPDLTEKIKEYAGGVRGYVNEIKQAFQEGGVGQVIEKLLPTDVVNEAKEKFGQIKEFINDLQTAYKEKDWEALFAKILPKEKFQELLDVKDAGDYINGIKKAFQAGGLEKVFQRILPADLFTKLFGENDLAQKVKDLIGEVKEAYEEEGLGGAVEKLFSQDLKEQFANISGLIKNLWSSLGNLFTVLVDKFKVIWDFLANLFTKFFSWLGGIGGRAAGGPVTSDQPYIVGEHGPELFVPGANGHIVPNHRLSRGEHTVNAPQVTVNVINNSGRQVQARQESHFDGQQYVVSVWLDALSRNVGGMRDIVMGGGR